jgi:hypothetical protein
VLRGDVTAALRLVLNRAKGVPARSVSVRPATVAKASSEGWRLCLRPNKGIARSFASPLLASSRSTPPLSTSPTPTMSTQSRSQSAPMPAASSSLCVSHARSARGSSPNSTASARSRTPSTSPSSISFVAPTSGPLS